MKRIYNANPNTVRGPKIQTFSMHFKKNCSDVLPLYFLLQLSTDSLMCRCTHVPVSSLNFPTIDLAPCIENKK